MVEKPVRVVRVCAVMRLPLSFVVLLTAGLLGGCNTFEKRAEQKAGVFAALSPETQERLKNESIRVGDTEDMVFIAFGKPDETKTATTAGGATTTWIYNRYWQEYQGEAYGGFRRQVIRDPKTGATSVYLEPVSRPVYETRRQQVLRVRFEGGKVTVIEQPIEE
ncbi:MAG TPA: hypothetical protein VK968_00580 [Roseimicrobium sp.]|nr:hypothetical protein [Roseimicrobium sp.]